MYISAIEIFGFKSFAARTRLEFGKGITAVVGPNGSGKSNIFDAVRWCVGEQSPRELRGGRMSDVLFHGSATRQPTSVCSVEIYLDNAAKDAPAPYTDAPELVVARKLYRSGDSEYLINGKRVRLRDIQEFWMDAAVGAYTFMEQGRVAELVQARPKDVRGYIEEAAQVVKFRRRIEESQRKFEAARAHLEVLSAGLSEEEKHLGYLERQAVKARRYLELVAQKKEIDLAWYASQAEQYAVERRETEAELDRQRNAHTSGAAALASLEASHAAERDTVALARRRQQDLYEQIQILAAQMSDIHGRQESLRAQREAGHNRELDNQRRQGEIETTLAQLEQQRQRLDAELKPLEQDEERMAAELGAVDVRYDAARSDVTRLLNEIERVQRELHNVRERTLAARQARQLAERELEAVAEELAVNAERRTALESKAQALLVQQQSATAAVQGAVEAENAARLALTAASEAVAARRGVAAHAAASVREAQSAQARAERDLKGLQATLEKSQTGKQDKLLDAAKAQALVAGQVADLLASVAQDAARIEQALGPLVDAWIVPADKQAEFEALLEQWPTQSRFVMPDGDKAALIEALSNLEAEDAQFRVRSSGNFVRRARGFREAGTYHASGSLILRQQIARYEEQRAALVTELESLRVAELTAQSDVQAAEAASRNAQQAVHQSLEARRAAENAEREARTQVRGTEVEVQALATRDQNLADRRSRIEERRAQIPAEDYDSEVPLAESLARLRLEIDNARTNLAESETQRASSMQTLTGVREQIRQKRGARMECETRRGVLETERERLGETSVAWKVQHSSLETQLQSLQQEATTLENQRAVAEKEWKAAQAEADDADVRRAESEARIRDQMRTVSQQDTELARLTERVSHLAERIDEVAQAALNEYNVELQGFVVPESMMAMERAVLQNQRLELEAKIRKLGGVDPEAVQEYETRKADFDAKIAQKKDLEDSITKLTAAIRELQHEARTRFDNTYKEIDHHFREVFPRLFPGGRAELRLDDSDPNDPEPGVMIMVYPPGKRFERIDLLSGGEKSLTATALVLSIFLCRPSPFCLADELDAPLDDANLDLLAAVLRDMNEQSQVILVTHNKSTMKIADRVYGVTLKEPGVGSVYSIDL